MKSAASLLSKIRAVTASTERMRSYRDILWRIGLCWLSGILFLWSFPSDRYDFRLSLRGSLPVSSEVILLESESLDLVKAIPDHTSQFQPPVVPQDEITYQKWHSWIERMAERDVSALVIFLPSADFLEWLVALEKTHHHGLLARDHIYFSLPSKERALHLKSQMKNVYTHEILVDSDGVARVFHPHHYGSLHLVNALTSQTSALEKNKFSKDQHVGETSDGDHPSRKIINFSGPAGTFKQVGESQLAEMSEALYGRIVLTSLPGLSSIFIQTPTGLMSVKEATAHILESSRHDNWIRTFGDVTNFLLFLPLLGILVLIALSYPQEVVFCLYALILCAWTAVSVYLFDRHALWLPTLAPALMALTTFVVFLSYQLSLNEKKSWLLEQEQKSMRELEQLKQNFISLISHDLKTPVAKIQGVVDRLLLKNPDGDTRDLRSLRRSSDELNKYIHNIVSVLRFQDGGFQIQREPVDVNSTVEQVIAQIEPLALEKSIEIAKHLEPMFSIEADPTLLHEMILNLIDNAIKYTPVEGRIQVFTRDLGDEVEITVRDNGFGIKSADQRAVWGRFHRGSDLPRDIKGSGLGLYLVKYFTDLHGGMLTLKSAPDAGTTVVLKLPVTHPSAFMNLPTNEGFR